MHPHFIWAHIELLLLSVAVVVFAKVFITVTIVRLFGDSLRTSLLVAIGLGQVGEFAFLLLSHAKRLKLLPKRMYLLALGTTALSLLLTPLQWKAALLLAGRLSSVQERPEAALHPQQPPPPALSSSSPQKQQGDSQGTNLPLHRSNSADPPLDIGAAGSRSPASLGGAKEE
mmetsp:Transcript_2084/g.6208  ORF Transcript_2084/g.6208 Transcript_2084/m.6208 type:complete len:172 (+) Transcript_2084:913-1428(+)